jgi:uncharacterized protein (TIGR00106 family)
MADRRKRMAHIIADVSLIPIGTASTSLSAHVAALEKVLHKHKRVASRLTPMSTILEGDMKAVLNAIMAMHEELFRRGARRVATRINIDDRRDKKISMNSKLSSVRRRLR